MKTNFHSYVQVSGVKTCKKFYLMIFHQRAPNPVDRIVNVFTYFTGAMSSKIDFTNLIP